MPKEESLKFLKDCLKQLENKEKENVSNRFKNNCETLDDIIFYLNHGADMDISKTGEKRILWRN